jgi:tetratricopeptide (TPR) repeat protein
MSFDKTKAMRNAERSLSQGKIRAAIIEYQRVVESDPKDYSTMNILGDLYAKDNDIREAVNCFKQVAEHYGKQGFAQKAIAIYNKIAKLDPESIEVSEKLAQLYQSRGSNAEARSHYAALAEQFQKRGKKAEALEIWKQIAKLDPNNTEVYLKVAEFCLQNSQKDEAAKAYTEAGMRLASAGQTESALTAFTRALEIRQYDLPALNGFVKAQIKLGDADEAADRLEKILEQSPYNREILYLLVDCHLESKNAELAERAVVRLVEQEPANYPKFIELVELYVNSGDLASGARVLAMSSEHLLVGGRHEEFLKWVNEVLARDPEQLDALRLLVRYHGWQRDETELKNSLERLSEIARLQGSIDDEKYALTQLVLIAPYEIGYAKRLQEIKVELGEFSASETSAPFATEQDRRAAPEYGDFLADSRFEPVENSVPEAEFALIAADAAIIGESAHQVYTGLNGHGAGLPDDSPDQQPIDRANVVSESEDRAPADLGNSVADPDGSTASVRALSAADEMRLSQEIESIDFYIAQGYRELAERSICALQAEFGNRPEFDALRDRNIPEADPESIERVAVDPLPTAPEPTPPVQEVLSEPLFGSSGSGNFLDEFRSELGLEEPSCINDDDYETVFHTAIAYKEMGLLEDSIRSFQDAVNRVRPDDGTRRFFNCCNLLGHCFMEKQMPNLGIMWYRRALETPGLSNEERHAMFYELGGAYANAGDQAKAIECFERIYAVNVDYRDVSSRLEALYVPRAG